MTWEAEKRIATRGALKALPYVETQTMLRTTSAVSFITVVAFSFSLNNTLASKGRTAVVASRVILASESSLVGNRAAYFVRLFGSEECAEETS